MFGRLAQLIYRIEHSDARRRIRLANGPPKRGRIGLRVRTKRVNIVFARLRLIDEHKGDFLSKRPLEQRVVVALEYDKEQGYIQIVRAVVAVHV